MGWPTGSVLALQWEQNWSVWPWASMSADLTAAESETGLAMGSAMELVAGLDLWWSGARSVPR